ncbi:hypothetical protein [Lachnotalea glycerini]|uniref:Tetratricopeptide repeat protein n=1 Tax=Lachnotalea glycerini TaxID=1763509 RepID=A0A371JHS1_9FIRM|nr:hypothetical protein [Lachnotalea glycerini]RDY32282.1 hypothetical protein CG710_004680 [Lachnotalea glycerini]
MMNDNKNNIFSNESAGVWINSETQNKVEEKERKYKQWIVNYRNKIPMIIKQVDEWLKRQEDFENIVEMFMDESFKKNYSNVNEMLAFYRAINIYMQEIGNGVKDTIFHKYDSFYKNIEYLTELKLQMWRAEFNIIPHAQDYLYNYIEETNTSIQTLLCMLCSVSMNSYEVTINLANLFLKHEKKVYAFEMFKYANEIKPGEEIVLCCMARLCLDIQLKEVARDYLKQILHPTKISETLRTLCEA